MTQAKTPKPRADLAIIYRAPTELVAYSRNSRTHTDAQITKLRASIREFGFTNPVLLKEDGKTIGAGHARTRAAIAEKLDKVPTIILAGLSDAQWRAYVIADNQLAITGSGWDMGLLESEMIGLALTDGSAMHARMGAVEKRLAALAGVEREQNGAQRHWTAITAKALATMAQHMGGEVAEHWEGASDGRAIVYSAAIFLGVP